MRQDHAKGTLIISEWKSAPFWPNIYNRNERVIVIELQLSNFSAISWREQVNFQCDDDDVRFILEQHT
jgi:hypothetical protein